MNIEDLIERLKTGYTSDEKALIIRAYEFAKSSHKGQFRKSGEPYIIHPVAVACILAEMHADVNTIAAGLLHDVVEDTKVTKNDIAYFFNDTIAELVDGVTKIKKEESASKEELKALNTYKILNSMTKDVRIFIIKLADRLHNMRTMEYQTKEKQQSKSQETLDLYVPFADFLGEYHFKLELEDLAFKYLNNQEYKRLKEYLSTIKDLKRDEIDKVLVETCQMLNSNNINYDLKLNVKSIYEVYKRLKKYKNFSNITDLLMIKIILDSVDECYFVNDLIDRDHTSKILYAKSKDYIKHPKTNRYEGLHTTIEKSNGDYFQYQLKTKQMYDVNAYGITAYWGNCENVDQKMQDDFEKSQMYKVLKALVDNYKDPLSFEKAVNKTFLQGSIYPRNTKGEYTELPVGSNVLDYAYYQGKNTGDRCIGAKVNGTRVSESYKLGKKDVVDLVLNGKIHEENAENNDDRARKITTEYAKIIIKNK